MSYAAYSTRASVMPLTTAARAGLPSGVRRCVARSKVSQSTASRYEDRPRLSMVTSLRSRTPAVTHGSPSRAEPGPTWCSLPTTRYSRLPPIPGSNSTRLRVEALSAVGSVPPGKFGAPLRLVVCSAVNVLRDRTLVPPAGSGSQKLMNPVTTSPTLPPAIGPPCWLFVGIRVGSVTVPVIVTSTSCPGPLWVQLIVPESATARSPPPVPAGSPPNPVAPGEFGPQAGSSPFHSRAPDGRSPRISETSSVNVIGPTLFSNPSRPCPGTTGCQSTAIG